MSQKQVFLGGLFGPAANQTSSPAEAAEGTQSRRPRGEIGAGGGGADHCVTAGSGDQHQNAMLMIRLARFCTLQHDSAWYSAGYGPKLDPSLGVLIS